MVSSYKAVVFVMAVFGLSGAAYASAGGLSTAGVDGPASAVHAAVRMAVPAAAPVAAPTVTLPARERQLALDMVTIVNRDRAARGLAAFIWNDQVAAAADVQSADMAAHHLMQHAGSDGSDAGDRLTRAGFTWTSWGENVAAGFDDPAVLFQAWMNSPGHRAHLLSNERFVGVGVAFVGGVGYWTLDVAS